MASKYSKKLRETIRSPEVGRWTERGVTFERKANGEGVFSVNVMVDGNRIHRIIGRESEGVNLAWVERVLNTWRAKAVEQRLGLPKNRKVAMGFAEAADRYIERLGLEGGKDLRAKRRRIEMHLKPFFKSIPLASITTTDIERYKLARLDQVAVRGGNRSMPKDTSKLGKTRPGTINRELAALSHLLHKVVEWGWINFLPVRVPLLPDEAQRIIYLSVEDCDRVLERAKADDNDQIYAFILIGLRTSMRLAEILSIRREHVDLAGRVIFIPKAKAGARKQPMPGELAQFLKSYIAALPSDTPWLFPSVKSRTGHTANVRKAFRRVVKAAGLDPDEIVRHTLRHTAITHMVQALVNLPTVKVFSGHKTLAMV